MVHLMVCHNNPMRPQPWLILVHPELTVARCSHIFSHLTIDYEVRATG